MDQPSLTFAGFGGVNLAAEAFGNPDDPAVLLLHGGAQDRHVWREAALALAGAGRRAITIDLRGHGQSDWPKDGRYDLRVLAADLRAVLAQLESRPVVVGASLGGYVALAAMGDGGQRLASGLVLVDAMAGVAPGAPNLGPTLRRHSQGFATLKEAAAGARELWSGQSRPDTARLRQQLRQGDDGRFYWNWDPRFLDAFDPAECRRLVEAVEGMSLPILVMQGQDGGAIASTGAPRFTELAPSAEVVAVETADLIAAGRFEAFNAALLEFLERRAPRAPITYEIGSDPRTLRDALGCFGTGVIIATTLDAEGKPWGVTANSFTSVSLDPPLVLFCIAKTANSFAAFETAEVFAVNVLHMGQQPDSQRFAKRAEDRFHASPWEHWDTGAPILSGSLASFECAKHAWHDAGDHVIVVGHVRRARFEPRRDPLLFFRGAYRRLHFF